MNADFEAVSASELASLRRIAVKAGETEASFQQLWQTLSAVLLSQGGAITIGLEQMARLGSLRGSINMDRNWETGAVTISYKEPN